MVRVRSRPGGAVVLAAGVVLLGGCGDLSGAEVEDVATAFARAGGEPATRCDLLAGSTLAQVQQEGPCEDVLVELPLGSGEVTAVEVWGEEAQVRLSDDTLFLTRTADGWRISAAACTPRGAELPYACEVSAS